jgi:hypothetical protein
MKKHQAPFSIRLIYWFTNFMLGMLALVTVLVIMLNIMAATGRLGDGMELHTEFPARVDILEQGTLHIGGKDLKVELVEASAKIHIINTPAFITGKFGLALLVVIAITGFMFWTFRKFIVNVKEGKVFNMANIKLLKHLAYGLVAFWLLIIVYMRVAYHFLARQVSFEHVRVRDDIPEYGSLLLVALFIWVLAHIFRTGLELQEERDLTV